MVNRSILLETSRNPVRNARGFNDAVHFAGLVIQLSVLRHSLNDSGLPCATNEIHLVTAGQSSNSKAIWMVALLGRYTYRCASESDYRSLD